MFMKRMIQSSCLLLLATSLPAWGAAPDQPASTGAAKPAAGSTSLFGNDVVAKGKGVEITRNELDDKVIRLKAQASARGQAIPPEQAAAVDRQVLDQLIQLQLLRAKATPADKAAGRTLAESGSRRPRPSSARRKRSTAS